MDNPRPCRVVSHCPPNRGNSRERLEQLFGPEADPSVVRLLAAHLSNLSEDEIRASLGRARIRFDYSIDPHGPDESAMSPLNVEEAHHLIPVLNAGNRQTEISLQKLIEAGIIHPPMQLEKPYKGHQLIARVETNGTVTFGGTCFHSPSMAGKAARISIIGPGIAGNTNGWVFWRFKDSDGHFKELDVLRQRYMSLRES